MEYDIKTLNSLISTTIDSVDGYHAAAANAENSNFREIFKGRANEREDVVLKLQTYVRDLGGTPEDDGSATAGAHRFFMKLRDSLTGTDDEAVVAEVERGEDYIKAKYEAALADNDLALGTRDVVQGCFTSIRAGHDQMRDLKQAMSGENAI
ncbi:MAG: PA2169 family four-helix-bundle protein [Sphingorhabdus sp.]